MKPHRISPSAHDPRNAVMAEWAGTLACLEWVVTPIVLALMPMGHNGPPSLSVQLIVITVSSLLMLVGWRGLISGHVKRMGSVVLFASNAFLVLFFLLVNFLYWFRYNYG